MSGEGVRGEKVIPPPLRSSPCLRGTKLEEQEAEEVCPFRSRFTVHHSPLTSHPLILSSAHRSSP